MAPLATLQKIELSKWSPEQRQQAAAVGLASGWLTAMGFIGKHYGEAAVGGYLAACAQGYAARLKAEGVATPLELARRIAEHDLNVVGSKIEVRGDASQAEVTCYECGVGGAAAKVAQSCGVDPAAMGCADAEGGQKNAAVGWLRAVADAFGFSCEGRGLPPSGYQVTFKA
ncbi:MAG: hypothetical protein AB1515_03485 [Nitrospirota bacterium]